MTSVSSDSLLTDDFGSLAALYDLHATRVFSLARRIVRDTGAAEDVVQEVFLQAWTQRDRYDRDRGPVRAWLLMLTRSRSVDRIRSTRREESQPGAAYVSATVAAHAFPDVEATRVIRDALVMLPTEQRRPLELAFYEGYTYAEVAALLKQPIGTVKTRIRRGMQRLRTILEASRPMLPTL